MRKRCRGCVNEVLVLFGKEREDLREGCCYGGRGEGDGVVERVFASGVALPEADYGGETGGEGAVGLESR